MHMYAAMNKKNGVSLTSTISDTYSGALSKAVDMGLDMSIYMICRV